jgi:hypothetical protein
LPGRLTCTVWFSVPLWCSRVRVTKSFLVLSVSTLHVEPHFHNRHLGHALSQQAHGTPPDVGLYYHSTVTGWITACNSACIIRRSAEVSTTQKQTWVLLFTQGRHGPSGLPPEASPGIARYCTSSRNFTSW